MRQKIDPKSCLCVGHFNKYFRLIINKLNAGEKQPLTYTRTHTEKVAHLHLNMACLFLKKKNLICFYSNRWDSRDTFKAIERNFIFKRYEFTYKYKKLIGEKSLHHCLSTE